MIFLTISLAIFTILRTWDTSTISITFKAVSTHLIFGLKELQSCFRYLLHLLLETFRLLTFDFYHLILDTTLSIYSKSFVPISSAKMAKARLVFL